MIKLKEEIKEAMGLEGLAVFLGKKPLEMDNYVKAVAEVAKRYIESSSTEFFIWLVRKANVIVVDAENALECPGLSEDKTFVPVLSLKSLYQIWLKENGVTTEGKPDKWGKVNKQFGEIVSSMTGEDKEAWHALVLYKRKLKENGITE